MTRLVLIIISHMANFYRVVRSLLDFSLAAKYTKCASKVRKYGPEMREITPKWRIDPIYDVGHAKTAQKFLDSNFWEQIPVFTTRLIPWPGNKNSPYEHIFVKVPPQDINTVILYTHWFHTVSWVFFVLSATLPVQVCHSTLISKMLIERAFDHAILSRS